MNAENIFKPGQKTIRTSNLLKIASNNGINNLRLSEKNEYPEEINNELIRLTISQAQAMLGLAQLASPNEVIIGKTNKQVTLKNEGVKITEPKDRKKIKTRTTKRIVIENNEYAINNKGYLLKTDKIFPKKITTIIEKKVIKSESKIKNKLKKLANKTKNNLKDIYEELKDPDILIALGLTTTAVIIIGTALEKTGALHEANGLLTSLSNLNYSEIATNAMERFSNDFLLTIGSK